MRQEPPHALACLQGEHDVLAHRQVGHDAVGLAIFGAQPHAEPHRVGRAGHALRLAAHAQLAAIGRHQPEQQLGELGAAGSQQPAEPKHLAGTQRQVGGLEQALARHAAQLEQRRRARAHRQGRGHGAPRGELAPDHRGDEPGRRQLARRVLAHQLAVAQHRDAVGQRIHLVDEMGHEQDRHALVAQPAQHREQPLHLLVVEARGGLVEHEHVRLHAERARDGHHLLHRHRIGRQQPGHVDLQVQAGEQLARLRVHRRPVDAPVLARIAPGEDVLGHREVRAEVHLLVHGTDAQALRLERRARLDGLAAQADGAGVGGVHAGEHLDERGLAGAVLPHQRMHFAGEQAQAGAVQGTHAEELLADARELEDGRFGEAHLFLL